MYRYIWKIKLNNPDDEDKFLAFWEETSAILQTYPGALGTHVNRVRNEIGSLFLVAEWESKESRDAMSNDIHNGDSAKARKWRSYPKSESFGEIIRFAGEEIGSVFPEKVIEK